MSRHGKPKHSSSELDQQSKIPSENWRSNVPYTSFAASKALINVAEPKPVNTTRWRRYLKRWADILLNLMRIDLRNKSLAYFGFSCNGGKSFDTKIPWMVNTTSSIAVSLSFRISIKCQESGFSVFLMLNFSSKVWPSYSTVSLFFSLYLPVLTLNCLPRRKSSPSFIVSVALCSREFPVNPQLVQFVINIAWTYAHPLHYSLCRACCASSVWDGKVFLHNGAFFSVIKRFYSKNRLPVLPSTWQVFTQTV